MTQAPLPESDSLRKLQEYVWDMMKARGFNTEDPSKKMLMLTEEVGELAKAVRKLSGLKFSSTTRQTDVAEEVADVFIVLLALSTIVNVDIYDAFVAKEKKNRERVWA